MTQEGFLTKNIAGFTSALESVILNEELARTRGFIQSLDPRVKLFTFLLLLVSVSLAQSIWTLVVTLLLVAILVLLSKVPPTFFLKRVVVLLPFTAIIALPALFITPGDPLWQTGSKIIISNQGLHTAGFMLLRVLDSICFGMLLIMTTPWNEILFALRWFRLPSVITDILSMTYRYVFLLLHTANSAFLARRSRSLGNSSADENRRWIARTLTFTMAKSQHLSEQVYQAMLARGYQGEIHTINKLRLNKRDYVWVTCTIAVVFTLIWSTYR